MNLNKTSHLSIACLIFLVSGCCSLDTLYLGKRQFTDRNPTSYTFNASIDQIHTCLKTNYFDKVYNKSFKSHFAEKKTGTPSLAFKSKKSGFSEHIFQKPGTENDVYIYFLWGPVSVQSAVYYSFSGPLEFFANFHVHLESITETTTRVDVIADQARVHQGECFNGHCMCMALHYKDVEPTTIEEYRLLLDIGECFNEKDMPALKLPK